MWADICVANKNEIINSIDGFVASLNELKQKIVAQDKSAIVASFDQAKQLRDKNVNK
jgi:prephenate dehydrogenase